MDYIQRLVEKARGFVSPLAHPKKRVFIQARIDTTKRDLLSLFLKKRGTSIQNFLTVMVDEMLESQGLRAFESIPDTASPRKGVASCVKCKIEMMSGHSTGLCKHCRLVKCSHTQCGNLVTVRQFGKAQYCPDHQRYKRWKKQNEGIGDD